MKSNAKAMKKLRYWDIIEMPTYAIVISVILVQAYAGISTVGLTIAGIINWVVIIGAFSYIGFKALHGAETVGYAAKAGALCGAIAGIFAAIAGIASFYLFPQLFSETISTMTTQGLTMEQAQTFVQIGIYFSLVIVPIMYAGIGALMATLSHWVSR